MNNLTQSGQPTEIATSKDSGILEKITNPYPGQKCNIPFLFDEFTSLCPVTGQPDFGRIEITYTPTEVIVETKSLKMYLASYRNEKAFNESVVNNVLKDLVTLLDPETIEVKGTFAQRGGIQLTVTASHPEI